MPPRRSRVAAPLARSHGGRAGALLPTGSSGRPGPLQLLGRRGAGALPAPGVRPVQRRDPADAHQRGGVRAARQAVRRAAQRGSRSLPRPLPDARVQPAHDAPHDGPRRTRARRLVPARGRPGLRRHPGPRARRFPRGASRSAHQRSGVRRRLRRRLSRDVRERIAVARNRSSKSSNAG